MARALLLATLISAAATLAGCGDDEAGASCTADADCPDRYPVCDTRISVCVGGCNEPSDCSGALPTCNSTGRLTAAPAVCVCEPTSCPSGQECLSDGQCGVPPSCGQVGSQGDCEEGLLCSGGGACKAPCVNQGETGCLLQNMLCETSTSATTFGDCRPPAEVMGSCTLAQSHTSSSAAIIVSVETIGTLTSTSCAGTLRGLTTTLYGATLPENLHADGLRRLIAPGLAQRVFTDGPDTVSDPTVSFEGELTTVGFAMCISAAEATSPVAFYVRDATGASSHAACWGP